MNRLVLPLNSNRSSLIPLLNSFSRDSEVRKHLSEAEKAEAEESFKVFRKPVEFYNVFQRKANKQFLQRSLSYKLQAKNKRRIQVSISVRGAISDGLRTPNLFPLYIVLVRPVSTPNGERPTSYRFKKACKLTTFIEGQTVSLAQATFILPEINKLSTKVKSKSITMLLVSCADINNSEEIDLTDPHTFSPSYEGCCLYGKIPIDFLQSSISSNISLGEKVEVLSTVAMQSCYMKTRCSGQDKCLSFHFPHSSEALSISPQVPVTITAEERGAKDRSPYDNVPTDSPAPVMRPRAGNVVFFYRYYHNMLQKSEVTEDYTCPFCLLTCGNYNGLKCHLTASHDLLRYEFLVDEAYQAVIVYARDDLNIDEVFDRQVDCEQLTCNNCKPMRRQNQNENHVGPLVMNSVTPTIPVGLRDNLNTINVSNAAAITSVGPESTDLSVPTTSRTPIPSAKTRKLSVEQSAIRKITPSHERQFYHSQTYQPMAWEQLNAEEDSEDEVDDDVADIEGRILLEDFIDVDQLEKRLMHLWNSFIRKQRVWCDSHLPWTCAAFSDLHGSELVQSPELRSHWIAFIVKLWENGLIDVKTIENCAKIVNKYRHQTPNQVMRIAGPPC